MKWDNLHMKNWSRSELQNRAIFGIVVYFIVNLLSVGLALSFGKGFYSTKLVRDAFEVLGAGGYLKSLVSVIVLDWCTIATNALILWWAIKPETKRWNVVWPLHALTLLGRLILIILDKLHQLSG